MHRFEFYGMLWGSVWRNLKDLQNRPPSSLHGKQHKLTKRSAGGPALYNAVTWPVQKVNNYAHNMRRSPSYSSWLWKYLASEARSMVRLTQRLCALARQQQAKFIKFISRFGLELWKLSHLLAGDAAILPVGRKTASNQRPFRFQTQLFNCINGQNPSRSGRSSVSTRMLLLPRSNSHLLRLDLESHRSGAFVAQIGAPTIRYGDLDPWT